MKTAADLVEWMTDNPRCVGLSVRRNRKHIEVNPTRLSPIASVGKILVLNAYGHAVASGELDPDELIDVGELERWYVPNSDSHGHPRAVHELVAQKRLVIHGNSLAMRLDDVAWNMMRWSGNTSHDYLLARLEVRRVMRDARSLGVNRIERPRLIFGEFAAWNSIPLRKWSAMTPAQRAKSTDEMASRKRFRWKRDIPPQREYAKGSPRGRPLDWVTILDAITRLPNNVLDAMSHHLSWMPDRPKTIPTYYAKSGGFPGIRNWVAHLETSGGVKLTGALFLANVRDDFAGDIDYYDLHRRLFERFALDEGFFDSAARDLVV